eukprot:11170850-Lingulodinium_polyedra.AAC.1
MATTRARRAEAITELAHDEAIFEHMPKTYRYQRLARMRPRGCPPTGSPLSRQQPHKSIPRLHAQGFSPWRS